MTTCSVARVKVGPWGGSGGKPWDEGGGGTTGGIRCITVLANDESVMGMKVTYDLNGRPLKGHRHGTLFTPPNKLMTRIWSTDSNISPRKLWMELNFPEEFLTHVSGYYQDFVNSLSFRTNLNRSFGPLGEEKGTRFSCSVDHAGAIVGFCGRSGDTLDAIGLYIAVWNPDRFYHSMRQQGLLAYRTTSPLRLRQPQPDDDQPPPWAADDDDRDDDADLAEEVQAG